MKVIKNTVVTPPTVMAPTVQELPDGKLADLLAMPGVEAITLEYTDGRRAARYQKVGS